MIRIDVELDGAWCTARELTGGARRSQLHAVHETALAHPGKRVRLRHANGSEQTFGEKGLREMRRRNGFEVPEAPAEGKRVA